MKFQLELKQGIILKRYKRFLADIKLPDGEIITVHTPNTGSMKSCWEVNDPVILSKSLNLTRKYPYTLEMIHNGVSWIGINTHLANDLVEEALKNKSISELSHLPMEYWKREKKINDSRIDFFYSKKKEDQSLYMEVKNVTLKENNRAQFPDSVSERGTKHLKLLIELKKQGHQCIMFYLVQREDVLEFSPAHHIDPLYGETLRDAQNYGVEILVYQCQLSEDEIKVCSPLPFII